MILYWRRYGKAGGCRIQWGLSSVGRAPALQAGGREFESLSLHEAMRSGLHGTEDECACTDESYRGRKDRANARDEAGLPANPTPNCFKRTKCLRSIKAVCTLKTEYRIKESIKPREIWKAEVKAEAGSISWR